MRSFEVLKNKTIKWADDRGLFDEPNPLAQCVKLYEEVWELEDAIARGQQEETKDAIGDCMVVLTIIAEMMDMDLPKCWDHALSVIKDRKGKVKDGIFYKGD